MYTGGVLGLFDFFDLLKNANKIFSCGDPLVWGGIGWGIILVFLFVVIYFSARYLIARCKKEEEKASCAQKRDRCRTQLDRMKLEMDKLEEEIVELKEERERCSKRLVRFWSKRYELSAIENKLNVLKRKKKQLREKCARKQEEIEKYEQMQEEIENNFKNYLKNCEIPKKVKWGMALLAVILTTNGKNMQVTAQTFIQTIKDSWEQAVMEEIPEESELPEPADNSNEGAASEQSYVPYKMRENMNYNFILNAEQLDQDMEDEIEELIFLSDYTKDEKGFAQLLEDCRTGQIPEKLLKTDRSADASLEVLLNEVAEDLERPFLEKIEQGRTIQSQAEWERTVPDSSELKEIADKRIEILSMEESRSIRRLIYFRLANDYQWMGRECKLQNKEGEQIYYYYGMSIYCCYCALAYEPDEEGDCSDEVILNYIKARYKDIMDSKGQNVSEDIVYNAEILYAIMQQENDGR